MYVFQQRRKYVLHRLYLYSMYSKQAIYIISENDDLKGIVLLHLQIVFSGQVISKLIKDSELNIHIPIELSDPHEKSTREVKKSNEII